MENEHYSHEIHHYLLMQIASTCGLPIEEIDVNAPIIELGVDSIIAGHISLEVEKSIGMELPFSNIAEGASITDLTRILGATMNSLKQTTTDIMMSKPCPQQSLQMTTPAFQGASATSNEEEILSLPKEHCDIRCLFEYNKINAQKELLSQAQLGTVFFKNFSSPSTDTIQFNDQTLINFSSYNYLGFVNDHRVNLAAQEAIAQFGTSAASSRIVSGGKNIHKKLELALAELYDVENALVFVSGYATNVSVISHLMQKNDLIIHDSLSHNSIVVGSEFSVAHRLVFPHNNLDFLEQLLKQNRLLYERVLIVVEGLYSMDGDTAPLTKLIELKKRYKCLLMVDEAHSMGVLGENGLGLREHCHVASTDVDIWMGPLSKSFAGCGGYIAGCNELVEYLKYSAPGFVFSVGLAPPLAGASLAAIELLKEEPYRVKKLQENSQNFLSLAKQKGFDTGLAEGYAIIPIIVGQSLKSAKLANQLFNQGINAQPIIYPGVSEDAARLRFFISALHSEFQIEHTLNILEKSMQLFE